MANKKKDADTLSGTPLTVQQKKFCEDYVSNGFNGGRAYASAYGVTDKMSAAANASHMLKRQDILAEISSIESSYKSIGQSMGLDKRSILRVLAKMLHATKAIYSKTGELVREEPDFTARNNAITTYARLTGEFGDGKKSDLAPTQAPAVGVQKMSEEERTARMKEILASMKQK